MYNDQDTTGNVNTNAVGNGPMLEGMPVFDAAGEKVGTVSEHNVQGQYLVLHKGWLFPKDIYVPLNTVQRSDADGVYLSVYKDDLDTDAQYEQPPTSGMGGVGTVNQGTQSYAGTATTGTTTGAGYTGTDTTMTDQQDIRVPIREEELVVGKQQEEIGRVHLHKDVIEEQQTITEPVTREEVIVERVPVQGQYNDVGQDAFTEKDIDVPVMGEELVAGKRAVVTEEVRLQKQAITDQQQVTDTVRKERVTVEGANEVYGADNQIDQTQTTYTRDR
jgi:uncharacterized protein (TIGR02271 family)